MVHMRLGGSPKSRGAQWAPGDLMDGSSVSPVPNGKNYQTEHIPIERARAVLRLNRPLDALGRNVFRLWNFRIWNTQFSAGPLLPDLMMTFGQLSEGPNSRKCRVRSGIEAGLKKFRQLAVFRLTAGCRRAGGPLLQSPPCRHRPLLWHRNPKRDRSSPVMLEKVPQQHNKDHG